MDWRSLPGKERDGERDGERDREREGFSDTVQLKFIVFQALAVWRNG